MALMLAFTMNYFISLAFLNKIIKKTQQITRKLIKKFEETRCHHVTQNLLKMCNEEYYYAAYFFCYNNVL